jgi:hypothetical protein
MKFHRCLLSIFLVILLSAATTAYAGPVDPIEAGLAAELSVPDLEFFLLTQFVGLSPDTLTLSETVSSTGVSYVESGIYLGQPVNVTLSGITSSFPVITYTTSGTYGSSPWSGGGTITFMATSTGFTMDFSGTSLMIGTHSGLYDIQVTAADDGTNITFVNTTGTVFADGKPKDAKPTADYPDKPKVGDLATDDVEVNGTTYIVSQQKIVEIDPDGTLRLQSKIKPAPEPSTLIMFGSGILALSGLSRRKTW